MLRFALIYSCAMVVAGSSLLAELPDGPVPTQAAATDKEAVPTPAGYSNAYQKIVPAAAIVESQSPPTMELLQVKQNELKKLQEEVGDLQSKLGVAAQYQLQCVMAEVDMKKLREADPEIQWDDQRLSVVELLEHADHSQSLPTQQFRAIEQCLKMTGSMTTLMSPTVVTNAGQPVAWLSGGEFPVPVGKGGTVSWRTYGDSFIANIQPLTQGLVTIHAVPEHSVLDAHKTVEIDGVVVPHVIARRMTLNAKLHSGESSIQSLMVSDERQNTTYLLTALTLTAVKQLDAVADHPQLDPIPEDSELR